MTPSATVKNEAAERLRANWRNTGPMGLYEDGKRFGRDLDAALAAERRATVERVKHAVLFTRTRLGTPPEKIRVTDLLAFLDRELAR